MSLPGSGTITGADILTELAASPPISLADARLLHLAHKTALPVAMTDFYSKSAWRAAGNAAFSSGSGRTGFANEAAIGAVFGSLSPQIFRSVQFAAIYDFAGGGYIELSSAGLPGNYWNGILVNGTYFRSANAALSSVTGGYDRTVWSFGTTFGFTNGGLITLEVYY